MMYTTDCKITDNSSNVHILDQVFIARQHNTASHTTSVRPSVMLQYCIKTA